MIKQGTLINERITLTWYMVYGGARMGIFRFHVDPAYIPGEYDAVCTVYAADGEYEMLGFLCLEGRIPPISEFKECYRHMESIGYKRKKHDRAKNV